MGFFREELILYALLMRPILQHAVLCCLTAVEIYLTSLSALQNKIFPTFVSATQFVHNYQLQEDIKMPLRQEHLGRLPGVTSAHPIVWYLMDLDADRSRSLPKIKGIEALMRT